MGEHKVIIGTPPKMSRGMVGDQLRVSRAAFAWLRHSGAIPIRDSTLRRGSYGAGLNDGRVMSGYGGRAVYLVRILPDPRAGVRDFPTLLTRRLRYAAFSR
jgi:hypothetical protein